MCSGRVDMEFVLRAFLNGMDGVFIGGCRLGECNYTTNGNYHALNMVMLLKRLLEHIGINPERLRIEFMSSADGILFAEVINEFIEKIREIGPLGIGDGFSEDGYRERLSDIIRLVPYIKIAKRDKLSLFLDDPEKYSELYSIEEIETLLKEVPTYYIDPSKCKACMVCLRKCPVDAISGGKNLIHVIDQEKCIRCGTCFEACPPRFKAIERLVGKPAPPPIPEKERLIVRGGKRKALS